MHIQSKLFVVSASYDLLSKTKRDYYMSFIYRTRCKITLPICNTMLLNEHAINRVLVFNKLIFVRGLL